MICALCKAEIPYDTKTVTFHLDGNCMEKREKGIEVVVVIPSITSHTLSSDVDWKKVLRDTIYGVWR